MASYLQVPIAPSRCPTKTFRCSRTVCNSAKIPMPPLNPRDHFLQRLVSAAAAHPDSKPPIKKGTLPYLDLLEFPQIMSSLSQGGGASANSANYGERSPRRPPPDLPSILLHGRIVYIGMPLVPAVTELVISELLYLQYMDPNEPINLYINSTGTTTDDGEVVALESEGFAIYDTLMYVKNDIHTVCLGTAMGHACLLLAAGKKGKRFMTASSAAILEQPKAPPTGEVDASEVISRAKELRINYDMLVELLAKHTQNPVEKVYKAMSGGSLSMNATDALKFGVVDKVLTRHDEERIAADMGSREEWDKRRGVKIPDPF